MKSAFETINFKLKPIGFCVELLPGLIFIYNGYPVDSLLQIFNKPSSELDLLYKSTNELLKQEKIVKLQQKINNNESN